MVTFTLHTGYGGDSLKYQLDPFNPRLPEEFNILTPLKILVPGYGGLKVDHAIKNISKAYQDVDYNVIIGK